MKMKNLLELYSQSSRVIGQIFDVLKETIVDEFTSFSSGKKTLEVLEAKKNRENLTKQVNTDFVTFLVLLIFMVVLFVMSKKVPKDDEDEDTEEITSADSLLIDANNGSREASIHSIRTNADEFKDNFLRCDCGDSNSISQLGETLAINLDPDTHSLVNFTEPWSQSQVSIQTEPDVLNYLDQQQQQPKKVSQHRRVRTQMHERRVSGRDLHVKRTRSGLVYGEYST